MPASLLGALGDDQPSVGQLEGDAVVRVRGGVVATHRGRVRDLVAVHHGHPAGAVVEQGGPAVVRDRVARFPGGVREVGERRCGGVEVPVITVRGPPGAGVEDAEASLGGHEHVATVAGRIQPVEACQRQVGEHLEGGRVEDLDTTVVGDRESWRGSGRLGRPGGRRRDRRRRSVGSGAGTDIGAAAAEDRRRGEPGQQGDGASDRSAEEEGHGWVRSLVRGTAGPWTGSGASTLTNMRIVFIYASGFRPEPPRPYPSASDIGLSAAVRGRRDRRRPARPDDGRGGHRPGAAAAAAGRGRRTPRRPPSSTT